MAKLQKIKQFFELSKKGTAAILGSVFLTVLFFAAPAAADTSCRAGTEADKVDVSGMESRDPAETVGECTPPKKCDSEDCVDAAPADGITRVSSRVGHRGQNSAGGTNVGSTDHKGTDYAAAGGSAVYAAADGTVRIVKYNCNVSASGTVIGYGNYVAIEHDNGLWTVYAHLSAAGVSVGDRVKKGQVIGLIGNTGGSTGNHLHVEYRQGGFKGEVIDPLEEGATQYGLCTPPEEYTNKGTSNNNASISSPDASTGTAGGVSAGGVEANEHTDKDCNPAIFKQTYEKCLFCNLFKVAFNACSAIAKKSFETFANPVATVVALGFALWVAFFLLTYLSGLKTEEPKRFFKSLLQQAFVVLFVYLFLKSDSASFMSIALEPIFNTGFNLARLAMGTSIDCGSADGYGIITDGGLPASMGNSIICTIKAIQDKLTNLMAMGTSSMCVAFYTKAYFNVFPHLGYLIAGLGMWVGALALLFIFPFLMLDSVLHMGVACALLPLAIGAFAFKPTKGYVGKIWETFLHAMFQFVFLTIVILILCTALENIMTGAVSDEEVAQGLWQVALTKLKWIGVPFLKTVFVILLGWAVLGQIASFAQSFASSISNDTESRKIGGMAASAGKGLFNRVAKPALKRVGSDVGGAVRNAGSAAKSFAVNRYRDNKADKFMNADYRARKGIVEGKDENGNTTYTQNSKSWFLRRNKQTTLTMAGDQRVWTQEKRLSASTVKRTEIRNDIKTETIVKNGNVVSEKIDFNDKKYQNLLVGERIDTAAIEELRNNSAGNIDEINKAILYHAMETRMPGTVNSHFELRHMKDNGHIEVSKDENGNEVMKMTKVEENGTQHIYSMVTAADGKVTTTYEKIRANGNAEILRSNGIMNKKSTLKYDKNGNVKAGSVKNSYAAARRFTHNRSSLPVDAFGHLAGYMPQKEALGLNEEEWNEFCNQHLNERQVRTLGEFAD
ncbi:MAG: peptidoglycan DD-metalloendopeptidase family protein [Alphaproteobacteria bacterium]|nr:peptidoglycan DD-metalloendopeptidase family protein [Alphaproteobacteria bacterium]